MCRWMRLMLLICTIAIFGACPYPYPRFNNLNDPIGMYKAVDVMWNISYGTSVYVNEVHPSANGQAGFFYDSAQASFDQFSNGGVGGRPPDFGRHITLESQTDPLPFYMLIHYLRLFFPITHEVSLRSSGTCEGDFVDVPFSYTWNSSSVTQVTLPYRAKIHGSSISKLILDDLLIPGELILIDAAVTSEHDFLGGSGMLVFHSGFPNFLLYFAFDHNTGYTSLVYQRFGEGDNGDFVTDGYFGEYCWIIFPTDDVSVP